MSSTRPSSARPLADASLKELQLGDSDQNPTDIGLLALIREDLQTHDDNLAAPGFWVMCLHRLGNARMSIRNDALRAPLSLAYQAAFHGVIALWGIELPYNVKVGRRLRLEHHGCLIVGARQIGDDVIIRHSVTIGLQERGGTEFPVIGNHVEIGPGACIVGGIHVGDGAYLGPNTVVARDVPAGAALIGIPPRKVDLAKYAPLPAPKPVPAQPVMPPSITSVCPVMNTGASNAK
jgi:serine O-acetyltransferase